MPNAFDFSASPFDCLDAAEQRIVRDSVDIAYYRADETLLDRGVEASHLFAVRGYFGTSTRDIADAVGLRQPSLFFHFPSKQAIVEQLQDDGRRSYAEIGKAVGLSEAAVRQRVQKLTDSGVMQVVAVTDPMQLGFFRQAMIGVRVTGDTTIIAEKLSEIAAVDYVVLTAGSFDILAEVVCESDEQLIDLLNNDIRAIDGIQTIETFVYLKLQKQFYNWGTR